MKAVKKVISMLSAGKEPTLDDMGEALAAALENRDYFEAVTCDLSAWMALCIVPHLRNDAAGVKSVLDDFIAKKVKVVHHTNQNGSTH